MEHNMALRQRGYSRRASQQEDLAASRNRHEEFRSSMFSTSRGYTPTLSAAGSSGGGGGAGSMDSEKPSRIEAAILAGMDLDAQRGHHTFNTIALTPAHSVHSSASQGRDPTVPLPGHGAAVNRFTGGLVAMPAPGAGMGMHGGGGVGTGYYGDDRVVYKTYHVPSGVAGSSGDGGGGYPSQGIAADGGSGSLGQSDGSRSAGLNEDVGVGDGGGGGVGARGSSGGSRGGGGGDSRGGGSGSSNSGVFRYSGGEGTPHSHQQQHPQHPHPRRGDSGDTIGRGGGQSGSSSAGGSSSERHRRPPTGGRGNGRDGGRGMRPAHQESGSSGGSDGRRQEVAGQDAFGPLESDGEITLVEAISGGSAVDPGENGDGGGLALTPPTEGYDEGTPLELPDGCHHISLSKFLEVMTGPGLRVRKHHRAGKGSSGLRVLRYAPEEDSLTWDSHKILGAAQHVLPMADVTKVSMKTGNRVVLTCVGGRDSYAVFEAVNADAGAVLYVGLERLRNRTVSES